MCIAIAIKKDQDLPSEDILQRCFKKNPDGAGYAYALDGIVHFEKGFMTYEAFRRGIEQIPKGCPCLLHFRIGTAGGHTAEYTHPFPYTNDVDSHFVLAGTFTGPMVVHNGCIPGFGESAYAGYSLKPKKYGIKKGPVKELSRSARPLSDTQDYLIQRAGGIIKDADLKLLGGGKLGWLYPTGEILLEGTWECGPDGLMYSNGGYKEAPQYSGRYNECDPRTWGEYAQASSRCYTDVDIRVLGSDYVYLVDGSGMTAHDLCYLYGLDLEDLQLAEYDLDLVLLAESGFPIGSLLPLTRGEPLAYPIAKTNTGSWDSFDER